MKKGVTGLNIFFLDADPKKCAEFHADKHVVKMAVESTQILCSVYYFTGQEEYSPYKLTHKNHPCCVWARTSLSNWLWLQDLAINLCAEYTYRYGKIHKCEAIAKALKIPALPDMGFTPPACAMDAEYIISNDPVVNYRNYYKYGKNHLLNYKKRNLPDWLLD